MRRRGSRRGGRGGRANVSRIRRVIARSDFGFRLRFNADPPEYSVAPWWAITVVMRASGKSASCTPKSLWAGLLAQIPGLKTPDDGFIRLLSIRAYGLADGKALNLSIHDPDLSSGIPPSGSDKSTKTSTIADMWDWPGRLAYAHVGWKFGRITSSRSFSSKITAEFARIELPSDTDKALVYLQVLVRFVGSDPLALARTDSEQAVTDHDASTWQLLPPAFTKMDV